MDTSIFEISQERGLQIKSVIPERTVLERNDNTISSSALYLPKSFIEANTVEMNLSHLKNKCVIPVFSKDNERTLSHQEFIEITMGCVSRIFPNKIIEKPEIRVSHEVKGRIPEAINRQAKDLLEHERTQYFERMAFIIRVPSIIETINGNEMSLVIGGVRSYNLENLYSKKSFEKFKFFIGFQVKVCCNLCVSTDGFAEEMRVTSYVELQAKIMEVLRNYNAEKHLVQMKALSGHSITEHQFAQLLGRARLYQHLPKKDKINIPALNFNDGQLNNIAKDYYENENFGRNSDGDLNLWNMYNLFTQANKSSYIDTFLDRNVNAFDFSNSISKALNGKSNYHWFLS